MAKSDQKPNRIKSLPLKIPNLSSLPKWVHWVYTVIVMPLCIAAVSYFIYLCYELVVFSVSERNYDDARNIALMFAALIGAPFVVWRVWTAHRQANLAEESHHADLFTKAAVDCYLTT